MLDATGPRLRLGFSRGDAEGTTVALGSAPCAGCFALSSSRVSLGEDVYPSLRNREVAIVPAKDSVPEQLFYLRTLGRFDLESEGEIVQP